MNKLLQITLIVIVVTASGCQIGGTANSHFSPLSYGSENMDFNNSTDEFIFPSSIESNPSYQTFEIQEEENTQQGSLITIFEIDF